MTTETPYRFDQPGSTRTGELPAEAAQETEPVADLTDLELLKADLPDIKVEDVKLPVPGRPLYAVTFGTAISEPELERWRKLAKNRKSEGGVDGIKLGSLVLANKCTGIYRDGRQLMDSDGEPLVFAHQEFLDLLGTPSAAEAVKGFYQLDSSITATAQGVMVAAGWGDELDPLD